MNTPVISVEGLKKSYGSHVAVDGLSFNVADGEIVGLLGPNGAGKTTTIEILEGLTRRDGGEVRVLGRDPARRDRALTASVGVVPQDSGIDGVLTVREVVTLFASFYRRRRAPAEVIQEVGLEECEWMRLSELSGGLRRRVDLALALVGDPKVLFLDEPTTGLDPAARRNTWSTIAALRRHGVAVLLTSHYLEEVQILADRVVVLRAGHLVADDTPDHIVGEAGQSALITFRLDASLALPSGPWRVAPSDRGAVALATEDPTEAIRLLTNWAWSTDVELHDLEVRRPSLEDRYLELTGEQ